VFSLLFARGIANGNRTLAIVFGILTPLVVALGIAGGTQFAHYQASVGGGREMDPEMCTWIRETFPNCIGELAGPKEAERIRTAQPTCYADDVSIASYARCMHVQGCKQMVDCVAN
jgi:hypothetical protein